MAPVRKVGGDSVITRLPPARLYLEEVAEIADLLRQSCKVVDIETDEYQLGNVEELASIAQAPLSTVEIKGMNPGERLSAVWVTLGRDPSVFSMGRDPTTVGLVSLIVDIVTRRRTRLAWFRPGNAAAGGAGFIVASMLPPEPFKALPLAVVAAVLVVLLSVGVQSTQRSVVFPWKRGDRIGFWHRNKDAILVGVITAMVTAVVTVLATVLITR